MIEPLGSRVLILPDAMEEVTSGGIILPQAHRERPQTGIVVAVGKDAKELKAGDKVIYGKYSGMYIQLPDDLKEYILLLEDDVVGKK